MIKRIFFLFFILYIGCTPSINPLSSFDTIEQIMSSKPDSALKLLQLMTRIPENRAIKARYALLYTEALHKNLVKVTSDSLIDIALDYYPKTNDWQRTAKTYFYKGKIYSTNNEWKKACENLLQAEQLALKTNDQKLLGLIYNDLGEIYWYQDYIEDAFKYYQLSYKYFLNEADSLNANYILGSIAGCYLGKNKLDSAYIHYDKALKFFKEERDTKEISYLESALLYVCFLTENTKRIHEIFAKNKKDTTNSFNRYVILSECHYYLRQYDSAQYYLKLALADSTVKLNNIQKQSIYLHLYQIEEKRSNYKEAFQYVLEYCNITDCLFQQERREAVLNTEKQFRNKLLSNQNEQLKTEAQIHYLLLIILILFLALLICLTIYWINRHKKALRKKENEIEEYLQLVENLKEQHKFTENQFIYRLNEKNREQLQLKEALEKRLAIIKQLTALSIQYRGKANRDIFYTKVNELMKLHTLTQEVLHNLCDIVNINYHGIIDFLKKQFPQLSQEDLEWCAFICSDFSPQEISVIYNVSVNYFYVKNNRLSSKMDINQSLPLYLKEMTKQLYQEKFA